MKKLLQIGCFVMIAAVARAQQQNPAEMQSQMNVAGQPQSAANTTLCKTPLKTYQQYYSAFTGGNFKSMAACYTEVFKLKEFDGHNPTDEDFAKMASRLNEVTDANFQLLSFIYTVDATKPKITFLYSYSRNQETHKEEIVLTLVDTTAGWKIDEIDNREK